MMKKMFKEMIKEMDLFIIVGLFMIILFGVMMFTDSKTDNKDTVTTQEFIEKGTMDHDDMMELLSRIDLGDS